MKHIMLVCNAGMSTSLLVTKMLKAAEEKDIKVDIWAVPVSEVADEVEHKEIDVLLVGPQVRFMLDDYKKAYEPSIKVGDINMMDYGVMNGANVLATALALLGE